MKIDNRELFNEGNLQTVQDVQVALETLEHDMPLTAVNALRNFNATYLIITRNVRQQLLKNTFENREFLKSFDTRFAFYYFSALQIYLQNDEPSTPWKIAFDASKRVGSSPFICMALGVNAHVNNDIPFVLMDCDAGKQHWRDYARVNSIIKDSIDEVISSLSHSDSLLSPQHRITRTLYKPCMHFLILMWRYNAWRKYWRLKRDKISRQQIEYCAQRTGDLIDEMHFI